MTMMLAGFAAVIALLPAALWPLRQGPGGARAPFFPMLAVAVLGPAVYVALTLAGGWTGGLADTLWVTVAAGAVLYAGLCAVLREAWRLAPLQLGYLALVALVAVGGGFVTRGTATGGYSVDGWLLAHIVLSVIAYALATLAAVAGAAVVIKQGALKRKAKGTLSSVLPAVAVADSLQVRLLGVAAVVLGADILTGMAAEWDASGALIHFEHKTLLSGLAFAVVVVLLALHARAGVRGRGAARGLLIVYLLLTLGYPGVKFVTDVLMT